MVSICISLVSNDVEHIFMYRQWPSVCLLWKTFIHICPFLKSDCLIFLLLSCFNSLYILGINSLSDIWFVFPFSKLSFNFVNGFLCYAEALKFDVVPLIFALVTFAFGVSPKFQCQDQCQGSYCLCFLIGVLWFQVLHLSF